jgi:hypothetical protein
VTARRAWRERVEPGIYRSHLLACRSSRDQRLGRRCECPWQVAAPGVRPGSTRLVTVAGTIGEARAERRRLMAEGRPEPVQVELGTVHACRGLVPGRRRPLVAGHARPSRPRLSRADLPGLGRRAARGSRAVGRRGVGRRANRLRPWTARSRSQCRRSGPCSRRARRRDDRHQPGRAGAAAAGSAD